MLKTRLLKKAIMEITGDMETTDDIMALFRLIKKQVDNGYTIMIVINESLSDFQFKVGKVIAEHTNFQDVTHEDDPEFFKLMGKMNLDTYMPETYFIKSTVEEIVYEIRGVGIDGQIN